MLDQDALGRRPVERDLAGEHLPQHHAERVDVAPRIHVGRAAGLLGAHVVRRPDDHAGAGETLAAAGRRLRDAEVRHEHPLLRALEHHVLRLDVAVDQRLRVRFRQRVGDVGADPDHFRLGQLALAPQPRVERLPVHHRHPEVDQPLALAHEEDREDVGMVEFRGRLGFADEALHALAAAGELGPQHLHGDLARELPVGDREDVGEAALADLVLHQEVRSQRPLELLGQRALLQELRRLPVRRQHRRRLGVRRAAGGASGRRGGHVPPALPAGGHGSSLVLEGAACQGRANLASAGAAEHIEALSFPSERQWRQDRRSRHGLLLQRSAPQLGSPQLRRPPCP